MSFKTSFDSKQPKLEPKLVLALSETKRLFRLFQFFSETESFDVSIEPEHILLYFTENLRFSIFFLFFRFFFFFVFSVFYGLFRNNLFRLFCFYMNRNKQKTHPNSLKESIFGYFSENLGLFRFVTVCYETDLFVSVVSI